MRNFKPENIKCKCGWEWVTEENDSHPYLCHECGFDSETHTYNFPALDAWKKSQIAKGEKPYIEERNDNIIRRTFSNSVDEHELTWHRDREDRIVIPINENDWLIQFDNELPRKLNVDEEFFIPKNSFHRVIKGKSDLVVEIIETTFEENEYEVYEILEEGKKKNKKKKKDACYYKVRSRYDVWPSAYACVPEKTSKALTKDGWKSVYELNVGDEIMTYNIEKDELEFKPILNLHRYKDTKTNVVRSGNNGFIFEATDNHKWVVKLPEIKDKRLEKYARINDKALIETSDLLANKNNKHLVVSAQYNGGENINLDKFFKYGTNWVKYILDITNEQRQAWLFSAIVYDGNQQKIERLTENINNIDELNWLYTGPYGKQSFGFKQKDIEHRDAFLLSAFLNSGLVTWKKAKGNDIYSCHYTSNKRFKNTSNFKLVKENISDVWCPETENGTWVMMQETDGNGIITITGNSGALVKCRKVGAKNWGNSTDESIEEGKKTDFSKEKEEGLHGWFARQGGKGKSKGWVDCNTCRKDPETGRKKCKSCGRKKGEKRDYPACRPTPSACGTRGKGKKWGKKSLEESIINVNVNSDLFKNRIPFLKQFKDFSEDNKVFFQKVDFNKDVDMFFGGDIINFKQVNTSIEFSYIIDKIHDNYFHMFNLKFELIIQPSDDLDDLTSKILMITFNKNINEKLSHFEEISSKNEKLNDEELNKIINIINGKFFEIENFITNKLKLNIKNPLNENIWNFK